MSFVTLFSCTDVSMAYLARAQLEDAGIPCFLTNEYLVGINWFYSGALGGVEVKVLAEDAARATEILRQDFDPAQECAKRVESGEPPADHPAIPEDPSSPPPSFEDFKPSITCPRCMNARLEYANYGRVTTLLCNWLIGAPLPFIPRRRVKCLECGFTWREGDNSGGQRQLGIDK